MLEFVGSKVGGGGGGGEGEDDEDKGLSTQAKRAKWQQASTSRLRELASQLRSFRTVDMSGEPMACHPDPY